jgi:hypothetical protein
MRQSQLIYKTGNIWGDKDMASAMFDNVTIYNKAFTEEEIETLYGEEVNQSK